jgi:hypothetical protein
VIDAVARQAPDVKRQTAGNCTMAGKLPCAASSRGESFHRSTLAFRLSQLQ